MDSTLTWVIGIGVGTLLIIQAAVFVGFFFLAKRVVIVVERASKLQTQAEYLINNTEPVLKMAHSLMGELKDASSYLAQGVQHFAAISEMAKDEAADVKDLLGDTTAIARREVERARSNVDKVQDTLTTATNQFQQTTAIVQQSVLQPAREFSYIMFGLRCGLEVLMTGNRLPVNRVYQDEEMFI